MTLVNIDLRNQGYETGPDDRVIFYSLLVREGDFGTISTAPVEVELTDGKASVDLAPGPVGVQILAGQVADTRVKIGEVPPSGTTTLNAVMMVTPAYTPALQKMMIAAIERAKKVSLDQVDGAVSMAIDAEVGEAIYTATSSAVSAANSATVAQQSASSADTRATSAETAAGNAVSRVEALEVVGGFAPGVPADGQTADFIAQPGTLTRKALNASYITHVLTATQLNSMTFPVGAVVRTNGFHSLGDGGACTYLTVPTVEKSYDLPGVGCAYRPQNESGVISPKQFGSFNNGSDFDNFPLQKCFDFSADYTVLTIDGQGLTYTIGPVNPYDGAWRGFAHQGALMRSGRTLMNARFFVHESSDAGVCALGIDMIDDGMPTNVVDCAFDGNRQNVTVTVTGREDSGMHLVHVLNRVGDALPFGEQEFTPTGDLIFTRCHLKDAYSYGIAIIRPIDALLRLDSCLIDIAGIAVQMHATRSEVIDTSITLSQPRAGMVGAVLHEEIEFGSNYTGSKKQDIRVLRTDFNNRTNYQAPLFKIHLPPMRGVQWDTVSIDDCRSIGNPSRMFEFYTGGAADNPGVDKLASIDTLNITRCDTGSNRVAYILAPQPVTSPCHVKKIRIDHTNGLYAVGITIDMLHIGTVDLADNYIHIGNSTIGELIIDELRGITGDYGVIRDLTSAVIKKMTVMGGEITQGGPTFIEGNVERIGIQDLTIHAEGSTTRRLVFAKGSTSEINLRNILMESATNPWIIAMSSTVTSGYVHARNVRHMAERTPTVSISGLPAERKILDQVSPLISAPASG